MRRPAPHHIDSAGALTQRAPHLAAVVYRGEKFADGVKVTRSNQRAAA